MGVLLNKGALEGLGAHGHDAAAVLRRLFLRVLLLQLQLAMLLRFTRLLALKALRL